MNLSQIRTDGGTQPREHLDEKLLDEYMEVLEQLPPVTVFYDGESYWLADGFHRIEAARRMGREEFEVEVKEGSLREAKLYSFSANAEHGFRRSRADKIRSVKSMLADPEWKVWNDGEIARACLVSRSFVRSLRQERVAERIFIHPKTRKEARMRIANLARPRKHAITVSLEENEWLTLEEAAWKDGLKAEEKALSVLLAYLSTFVT